MTGIPERAGGRRAAGLAALVSIAALVSTLAGCWRAEEPAGSDPGRPLLEVARPTILVESAELGPPTAREGSRFLAGWTPLRRDAARGPHPYRMEKSATLELVVLGPAAGTARAPAPAVILHLAEDSPRGGRLAVSVEGRPVGAVTIEEPIRLPLPAEVAAGPTTVRLDLEAGEPPVVAAGAVRPSTPAGAARVDGDVLVVEGRVAVEFLLPAAPGLAIGGRFVPATDRGGGGTFEASLATADRTRITSAAWGSGFWSRLLRSKHFHLELPPALDPARPAARFVRVRLEARGDAAGRWEDLRVFGPPPDTASDRTAASPPSTEPAPSATPPTGAPRPRLVVVYVMDALRSDYVGALGGEAAGVATPTWDRLAREGILAADHRSVAPNTMPSSKALFVGRTFVFRGGHPLRPDAGTTLAEAFRAAGYRTGLFSGNIHVSPAYGMERGFETAPQEILFDRHSAGRNDDVNDNAEYVQRAALAWLDSLPAGSSAFLYLHTLHPHNPYTPPEPFAHRFLLAAPGLPPLPAGLDGTTRTLLRIQRGRLPLDERGRDAVRALYRGNLAYNDAVLADFLRDLARRVPPEETLLALTSDHGEELFDHGGMLHGYTLYEELLRIPLVVWAPGRIAPRRIETPTDTIDLHDLLVDLVASPAPRSSAKSPESGTARPNPLLAGRDPDALRFAAASSLEGGIFSVQNRRWKVILAPRTGVNWGMGTAGIGRGRDAELWFRLDEDPSETVNRVGDPDPEPRWLRGRLLSWIDDARAAEPAPGEDGQGESDGTPTDPETRRALKALGYLN